MQLSHLGTSWLFFFNLFTYLFVFYKYVGKNILRMRRLKIYIEVLKKKLDVTGIVPSIFVHIKQ